MRTAYPSQVCALRLARPSGSPVTVPACNLNALCHGSGIALAFATEAHGSINHVRKYTGESDIEHPIDVMRIVQTVPHTEEMLVAALLRDTIEDTPILGRHVSIFVSHCASMSRYKGVFGLHLEGANG